MSTSSEAPAPRWGAFAYPNYRRFWISNLARVFGLQFRFIGTGWLVAVELDRSPIWLGIVGLAVSLPTILLSVPAGIVSDRYDTKRVLIASQGLTTVFSFALAIVILAGAATIEFVIAWSIAVGALAALANPAQQAILPRLIEMRAMASAVALNSMVWNTMAIVGPASAGVLIALVGTGQAFFVTALGFALSTFLVILLRLAPEPGKDVGAGGGMFEGVRYIFANQLFLATIGLSFFTSLFGASYQRLLPIFADDVLDVGSSGFGLMEGSIGLGAFLGTLSIMKLGAGRFAGVVMLVSAGAFGLFIAAFAASRLMPLSLGFLFCAGFTSSIYLNLGMTLLQLNVPEALRGRVMAVWSMTWFLSSVGGLPATATAEVIGTPLAVAFGALLVTTFAAVVLISSRDLRRPPRHLTAAATAAG
jgi:MFS family permease